MQQQTPYSKNVISHLFVRNLLSFLIITLACYRVTQLREPPPFCRSLPGSVQPRLTASVRVILARWRQSCNNDDIQSLSSRKDSLQTFRALYRMMIFCNRDFAQTEFDLLSCPIYGAWKTWKYGRNHRILTCFFPMILSSWGQTHATEQITLVSHLQIGLSKVLRISSFPWTFYPLQVVYQCLPSCPTVLCSRVFRPLTTRLSPYLVAVDGHLGWHVVSLNILSIWVFRK